MSIKQLPANRKTTTFAALGNENKNVANAIAKVFRAHGVTFIKSTVLVTQSYVVTLMTKGSIDATLQAVYPDLAKLLGAKPKIDFHVKLGQSGYTYWSLDCFSCPLEGKPSYITVDRLYGMVHIQF